MGTHQRGKHNPVKSTFSIGWSKTKNSRSASFPNAFHQPTGALNGENDIPTAYTLWPPPKTKQKLESRARPKHASVKNVRLTLKKKTPRGQFIYIYIYIYVFKKINTERINGPRCPDDRFQFLPDRGRVVRTRFLSGPHKRYNGVTVGNANADTRVL